MKENRQDGENLINNSANTNIKKFRVAFGFENQETPLIIELSFDEENKKILPDNKYFDKMHHNLKDKYKYDIKQVALKQWNKYLENKIKGYYAQISEDPADSYGDYLILVLFLEMVKYHWVENKLDEKKIWYNVESIEELKNSFLGTTFNGSIDYLKSNLMRIVFIDDFPMEVVPQLFKLQNFCTKPLEVDVTPFNLGKRIDYDKNDNKNRTEKVVKEVKKILDIKDDVTDPENSVESNLPKEEAVSKLKFVWVETMSQEGVATDWFLSKLCGQDDTDERNKVAYVSYGDLGFEPDFDPYINIKKYAPFLDPQTGPNSIETVEPSNNLNEGNKPESNTVDTIHDQHTGEPISVETFKGDSPGLNDSKDKEAPKNESSNEMDGKFKDFDPDMNKKKLDHQTVPNSIETVPSETKSSSNLSENTKTKRFSAEYETFEDFKYSRLGWNWQEARKKLEREGEGEGFKGINEDADNNMKDENKTKTQKSKGQLILTWIFLILCGIIFVGTSLGAYLSYLSGILFAWEIGIPVAGITIFSGLGFVFLLVKLKQQNSDISLSSDNKDTNDPKAFVGYNPQETKSPLLENRTENKDERSN